MDQQEGKTEQRCLMDALPIGEHQEWLSHPATKVLLARCKQDVSVLQATVLDAAKGRLLPEPLRIAALGAQLASREALLAYITEHSNE